MFEPDKDGVYARIDASPTRRAFGFCVLFLLGAMTVYAATISNSGFGGQVFLLIMGVFILWVAEKCRRATQASILLTQDGLFSSDGTELAAWDQIAGIDRGTLAFKPSNGFTVVMKTKQPRAWAPGLWWRIGRRVGVGGVLPAGATKFMAEQISLRLASGA